MPRFFAGWLGQLYTPARYEFRGKLAKTRFQRDCLSEYADVFKSVCVDAADYDFPRREYLQRLVDQVPDDFRFGLKVTDAITLKKFPNLDSLQGKGRTTQSGFSQRRSVRDRVPQALRRHPSKDRRPHVRVFTILAD